MNRPPFQLATVVAPPPANRSRVSSMLGPACPGVCVALQEIIRWVTRCGCALPLMVQMVCGCVASVTSARTVAGAPCMTSSASCEVGWPVQLALIAAQVGTCEPVAVGEGEGEAAADGVGVRAADAVGEVWTAAVLVDPQPTETATAASASSPTLRLTMRWNEAAWARVTGRPGDTGAKGYELGDPASSAPA